MLYLISHADAEHELSGRVCLTVVGFSEKISVVYRSYHVFKLVLAGENCGVSHSYKRLVRECISSRVALRLDSEMLRALAAVHVSSENAVLYENCVLCGRALIVDKNRQGSG